MNADEAAALLGVSATATTNEIKRAFRSRAKVIHPDRFITGSDEHGAAHQEFLRAITARDVLTARQQAPRAASEPAEPERVIPDLESVYVVMSHLAQADLKSGRARVARVLFWSTFIPGIFATLGSDDLKGQPVGSVLVVVGVSLFLIAFFSAVTRRYFASQGNRAYEAATRLAYTHAYYEGAMFLHYEGDVPGPLAFYRTASEALGVRF